MERKIRVLLADDQDLFVQSLKVVLETRANSIEIVGLAYDGEQALAMARAEKPDVILMDVRMPKVDGVLATKEIVRLGLPTRIIMLTTFDHDEYVNHALEYGAAGYLLKDIAPEDLIHAIHIAHHGSLVMASSVANKVIQTSVVPPPKETGDTERLPVDELSRKERAVFRLLVRGYDNHEIAQELFLAEQTVKNYVSEIYAKFDVHDRLHLIRLAKEQDLV